MQVGYDQHNWPARCFVCLCCLLVSVQLVLLACASLRASLCVRLRLCVPAQCCAQYPRSGAGAAAIAALVTCLKDDGVTTDDLAHGDTKYMGVCLAPEAASPRTRAAAISHARVHTHSPPAGSDAGAPAAGPAKSPPLVRFRARALPLVHHSPPSLRLPAAARVRRCAWRVHRTCALAAVPYPVPERCDGGAAGGGRSGGSGSGVLPCAGVHLSVLATPRPCSQMRAARGVHRLASPPALSTSAGASSGGGGGGGGNGGGDDGDGAPPARVHRRLDLRVLPASAAACALAYFTGPAAFNVAMRAAALKRGLSLSEYALHKLAAPGGGGGGGDGPRYGAEVRRVMCLAAAGACSGLD